MIEVGELRPIQAMAAALFFKKKRLLLSLPRQAGGKTELGVRLGLDLIGRNRPNSWLFVAKNTASRRKAAREKFLRLAPRDKFHVNTEMIYNKRCPAAQILMASVDKDPGANRGGTLAGIHWSEVAFSKIDHGESIPDTWQKVFMPMLDEKEGYALLESTTNGCNGFKDLWDDAKALGFHTFKMSLSQMVEMGLYPEAKYLKIKGRTHPLIFRQEYECDWITFQGLAYDEFNENEHVDPLMEPPKEWQKVVMAIDFGYDPSANCVLFAYVQDDIIYIFDEIHEKRQLIDALAAQINGRLLHYRIEHHAAVGDHEQDRLDELNLRGIACGKANKVNVLGARLQIKELLWSNRLRIHPRCKFLIKDMTTATWHDKREGDLDYSQCTYAHFDAESALRYLVRELSGAEAEEPIENPHRAIDDASSRDWMMRRDLNAV